MHRPVVLALLRLVLMGILGVTGLGCVAKKLVVRNADTLLEHQFKKRLPLYASQKAELSKEIKAFLNQHRQQAQEVLPIVDGMNLQAEATINEQYKKLAHVYDKIALAFSGVIAKFMIKLDSKQQKEFFETLDDENRRIARKDPEEQEETYKRRFKTFFGSVNKDQKQVLANFSKQFEQNNKVRLKRRKNLHQEFKEIYEKDLSKEAKKDLFQEAFKEYQMLSHNHVENIKFIQALLPSISKVQREFFRKRVAEVKEFLKLYLETDY